METSAVIDMACTSRGSMGPYTKHHSAAGKAEDVASAHAKIQEAFGAPQVLIYNAGPGGVSWPPPGLLETSPDSFAHGFEAGCVGALLWAQQVSGMPLSGLPNVWLLVHASLNCSSQNTADFAPCWVRCCRVWWRTEGELSSSQEPPPRCGAARSLRCWPAPNSRCVP